jgi:hypothetical protein
LASAASQGHRGRIESWQREALQHQCPAESLHVKNCANSKLTDLWWGRPLGANLAGRDRVDLEPSCLILRHRTKGKCHNEAVYWGGAPEKPGDQLCRSTRGLISSSASVERASCAPMARDLLAPAGWQGLQPICAAIGEFGRETWRASWMPTAHSGRNLLTREP